MMVYTSQISLLFKTGNHIIISLLASILVLSKCTYSLKDAF